MLRNATILLSIFAWLLVPGLAAAKSNLWFGLGHYLDGFDAYYESSENAATRFDMEAAATSSAQSNDQFLYFRNNGAAAATPNIEPAFNTAPSATLGSTNLGTNLVDRIAPVGNEALGGALGSAVNIGFFDPRYTTALNMSFSFTPDILNATALEGLTFDLSSSLIKGGVMAEKTLFKDDMSLVGDRRVYNLGFTIGYRGLSVGASYLRDQRSFESDYEGYDIALQFQRGSWTTNIQFAGYSQDQDTARLFFDPRERRQFRALEVGAVYALTRSVNLTGGFRYLDHPSAFLLDENTGSHLFFLGTNVNF